MLGTQEQRTEGMKRQAQCLIDQAYQRGFKAGFESATNGFQKSIEENKDRFIEQGRNEAWEAARKVACGTLVGGYSYNDLIKVFDTSVYDNIFTRFTATEAIKKLKVWEQKKEQQEDEINVGDEVAYFHDSKVKFIVTKVKNNRISGINATGEFSDKNATCWEKTGRTFPEIAQVLAKMKEGEK